MKQKLRRFMAGFLAVLTMFTTLFTNGTTAFAASSSANIAFWVASSKDHGVISEFNSNHKGGILYAMIDGHSAYCMNFGLSAKGGQLMTSDSNPDTNLSAAQEKLLAYCMYYGYSTTEAKAPTNDQCNKFIATQSMVWIIVNGIFGTSSADSAAKKLCDCAPDSSSSYSYYETLRDKINASYNATRPSFASKTKSDATTYELKWNEENKRFEYTFKDANKVLGNFDFSIDGFSVSKSGNSMTVYTKSVNTTDVIAENLVSGSDGQVVLSDLHLGTYVVTETKSIDGYTINTTPQTVKIEYKDQNVTVQAESTTIKNSRQKAEVSVVKKDSDTDNPLTGGQYTLYAGNDIKNYDGRVIVTKGAALQTITTGADGKATYTVDLPISNSFYIAETKAPVNYVRNSDDVYSFNFSVMSQDKAKATFAHTFKNDRTTAKIQIFKVDKETGKAVPQGDAKLEGAVYGLYARENIVHPDGKTGVIFKAGDLVATLTTDAKGACSIDNLYLGKYYVKEITPSEGYLLDEEEHDVVCDYEGDLIPQVLRSTTSKEQVIKQPFQLIKVSDNGDDTEAPLLSGAGFTAYLKSSLKVKADGSYDYESATPVVIGENGAKSIYTDEKGHAVSIAIPYGTYVVLETETPHNMETIKPFEVKIVENNPTEPQIWRVFIDREFTAKLRVVKKDADTKQTVLIPNTEFKIFNLDTGKYVTMITTYPSKVTHTSFFTDEDGDLILPEALKLGNYRIEEIAAPYGYVVNETYVKVVVDTDTAYEIDPETYEAIITVDYEDAPVVGELTVEKKGEVLDSYKGGLFADSDEKSFVYREGSLAGAKYEVYAAEDIFTADMQKDADGNRTKYYSEGELVAALVTGDDGKAVLKNLPLEELPLGKYYLVETATIEGFVLDSTPIEADLSYVDQDTEVVYAGMDVTNERQKVKITVLCSLEEIDEDGNVKKADMFYKQTIKAKVSIERVETAVEALNVSINEFGTVNLALISLACSRWRISSSTPK